jgi:serine/threonine protein phosphatase PrpC
MSQTALVLNDSDPLFETGAATHVGKVRGHNEDSLLARPEAGIWAVADGMGGHDAGDLASATVIEALQSIEPADSAAELLMSCERRVVSANATLIEIGRGRGATIGTTVAVLLTHDAHFACVWSGDSRIYLVRDGAISLQSRDHTVVQDLIAAGQLSPAEARNAPGRNVITRAIGIDDHPELEIRDGVLRAGDVFVLCSDGLTTHVDDDEILEQVISATPQHACDALIGLTLSRGAVDNVTIVVVRYMPDAAPVNRRDLWE